MDKIIQRKRSFKKIYLTGAVALALVFAGYSVLSDTSSRRVMKDGLEIKAVEQGAFSVYVTGNGTIVPRNVDYIMPKASGELIGVNAKSGDTVEKGQTLFVIENEELIVEYQNQEIVLAEAKAALDSKSFELETQRLQLEMDVMTAKSAYMVQSEEYSAYLSLQEKPNSPISGVLFQQVKIREAQLKNIYELETIRLASFSKSMRRQLNQYEARVDLAENILLRVRNKVNDLNLKSRMNGIIQDVDLKLGQRVEVGTVIGMVSSPSEGFVRLKVSAVQGHRLALGQKALISLHNEERKGLVVRIDPNVKGTTIDVDIDLDDHSKLPINMFVSGKIVVEELENALYVDAPLNGTIENGTSSFYHVSTDNSFAQLTKVDTGFLSAGKIQIRSALSVGDKIVVSDTGKFSGVARVSLH